MAFTLTKKDDQSVGAKKAVTYEVTADGAEDNLSGDELRMKYVDYFHVSPKSMATSAFSIHENVDSSGTAANGGIGISGVASGDLFFLTVYGR